MSVPFSLLLALIPAQDSPWAGAPLEYGERVSHDPVAVLSARIEAGEVSLADDERFGLLPALLEALDVPIESQTTVFSRTSFQAKRISPRRPRALYFSDDVYVGYVPGSRTYELTGMDAELGPVFYTLRESAGFERQTHTCLQCHAPSSNGDMPAHLVRSVHPDQAGMPVLRAGTSFVDHTTPYEGRWGGWYVTGAPENMRHLGNQMLAEGEERLDPAASVHGDLTELCMTDSYLAATSDIVALLVLEHQTHVQNVLARAGYDARRALYDQRALNGALGNPPEARLGSTETRLDVAVRRVVKALLMVGEPPLPGPIGAESAFTDLFQARGRRGPQGRSLRDLDLKQRLFRYPLSYLIHSPSFSGLPEVLRERIWLELWLVLQGIREDDEYDALSRGDRETLLVLLAETRDDLPGYW
jgi:hypothetical protein